MGRFERFFVIWTIGYLSAYVPVLVTVSVTPDWRNDFFEDLVPFHILGMVQNFACLLLMIRDLYKRDFPNPNSKLTWLLLILYVGPISWVLYLCKYGLRPRPPLAQRGDSVRQEIQSENKETPPERGFFE